MKARKVHFERIALLLFTLLLLPSITKAEIPTTFGELLEPIQPGFWKTQWENASISFDQPIIGVNKTIAGGVGLGFSVKYKYDVEPAFIRNYQVRYDIYNASLSLGRGISDTNIGVGTSANAKITFLRFFKDKWEAVKSRPYFFNRYPWDAERVINYLSPGDVVRIDLGVGIGVSSGLGGLGGGVSSAASVGVSKGSSLIADVYRLKNNSVRVRFIATRTLAAASFNISANHINFFTYGLSQLNNWLSRFFSLNILTASFGFTPTEKLPTETYMVDYVFNLNLPNGVTAFNKVMFEFRDLKYFSALNFQLSNQGISGRLEDLIRDADKEHTADIAKPINERSVIRIFKGVLATSYHTLSLNTKSKLLISLWDETYSDYIGHSLVQGWDENDNQVNLIYSSHATNNNFKAVQDLKSTVEQSGIDSAYIASIQDLKHDVEPVAISDLYFYRNLSDADLKASVLEHELEKLKFISPTIFEKINWDTFNPNKNKINGYFNSTLVIHQEALQALPKLTFDEVMTKIKILADRYPEVVYLEDRQGHQLYIDDVKKFAKSMFEILNENNAGKKMQLFEKVKMNYIFKSFGPAFIMDLIPEPELERAVMVKINAGSEDGSSLKFAFGDHDLSGTYTAIQAMNAAINDRSFDLRIQIDNTGKLKTYKSDQECTTCDHL